ncbi:MAG: aspartate ammonia-lyase [Calditrichia bacterium]
MNRFRIEKDSLGEKEIPREALYGIHAQRARENFPDTTPFHPEWYRAIGWVKLACYRTYRKFKSAALQQYKAEQLPLTFMEDETITALIEAAERVTRGEGYEHFIVPAICGGAGTSLNMNVNEIIANLALQILGHQPGEYKVVDPIEHANVFQSTNDIIPTSLKVALLFLLENLEAAINDLRLKVEQLEAEHRGSLRIAYTQMQAAVPSSYGKLFSTYNEALSRDWWRVSKCFERIKVVNLGGSAVGTGITVPRFFIFEVVPELQRLTHLPVTRSENLEDATVNQDSLVEIHAILKAHAVNLEKMSGDLRLLAADLLENKEIQLPAKQVGSSIMPGKINPVIPEFVISAAHRVYANDQLVGHLAAQGALDLNPYLPAIGHALLESLKLLIAANQTLLRNIFQELAVLEEVARQKLYQNPSIATALIPLLGYHTAGRLAKRMKEKKETIFQANAELKLVEEHRLQELLKAENLFKLGFSLKDVLKKDE